MTGYVDRLDPGIHEGSSELRDLEKMEGLSESWT